MKEWLRSRRVQTAVSLTLAAGLLAFFLSRVPLREIGRQIAAASVRWLLAALCLSLLTFTLRAIRWIWILEPIGRVRFRSSFRATSMGFAANTVLPARAGEVLRPAILARETAFPFSGLLASIVFERILDALAQLFFLGLALAAGTGSTASSLTSARVRWVVAGIAAVAVGIALFAVVWREATERAVDRLLAVLPERLRAPARRIAHTFLDGFASLKTPRLLVLVGATSIAMWFVINVQIYCVLRAFGLALPLTAAYIVTTAAVLGLAVPTPGGVGGYHAAVQFALTEFFRVPVGTATGIALLAHAISFVPISTIGFVMFAVKPVRRAELVREGAPLGDNLPT